MEKKKYITSEAEVEAKGCLRFTGVCVNLGKALNSRTHYEEYYCGHNFPDDCKQFGCPKYIATKDPSEWKLRKLGNVKMGREP